MSGPSSAQIPDASNSFRIHCFKSYSVNGFFSRTHFAACPNAPPMMRSIITPAEKWDSFCSRLQHASYFCTRSAELTTLAEIRGVLEPRAEGVPFLQIGRAHV